MSVIRFAELHDIDGIMGFISEYWKENHILSRNKNFFLYEHKDKDRINFVISYKNNKINGILGFIKYSQKDSDIATVMWMVLKDTKHPMLGLELFEFLKNKGEYNILFSLGINNKTIGIYNYLGFYTNHLRQYVLINHQFKKFNILKIYNDKLLKTIKFIENNKYYISELNEKDLDFDFDVYKDNIPFKDKDFFIKRYFNHPIYKYIVYGIYKHDILKSLIVIKEVVVDSAKVLRVIDYIGDETNFPFISKDLYQLLIDKNYEYIDFMCYGFDSATFIKSGFIEVDLNSSDILVPNYFAPFIQENIQLNFFVDTININDIRLCKGDGDQDRPN